LDMTDCCTIMHGCQQLLQVVQHSGAGLLLHCMQLSSALAVVLPSYTRC
jgi:hypothetical protein